MNPASEPIANPAPVLNATYHGFIESTYDALILFEACIAGQIKHVSRRPHDRERDIVIQSGNIFIYEEKSSGIKRWTDGISWSPSRILGNFLIYRQLVKAFGPGEKKKAIKKPKVKPNGIIKASQDNKNSIRNKENIFEGVGRLQVTGGTYGQARTINNETERALIGSLTDSYNFLEDGLVKKTISVTCDDVTHHLVSYYTIADAVNQMFLVPSEDPRLARCYPRECLLTSQNFRNPITEMDPMDLLNYPRNGIEMVNQSVLQRRVPAVVAPENFPSNTGKGTNMCSSDYAAPVTFATYEQSLHSYNLTLGHTKPYAQAFAPRIYPAARQHQGDDGMRFAVVSCSGSNGSRAPLSTATNLQRDGVNFHRRDSLDSLVSMGIGKAIQETDRGQTRSGFQGVPQEATPTANSVEARHAPQRSLQTDFAHQALFDFPPSNDPNGRTILVWDGKGIFQMGNASVGHGHY
jgi:Gti1/Pac2 family transcription factor